MSDDLAGLIADGDRLRKTVELGPQVVVESYYVHCSGPPTRDSPFGSSYLVMSPLKRQKTSPVAAGEVFCLSCLRRQLPNSGRRLASCVCRRATMLECIWLT